MPASLRHRSRRRTEARPRRASRTDTRVSVRLARSGPAPAPTAGTGTFPRSRWLPLSPWPAACLHPSCSARQSGAKEAIDARTTFSDDAFRLVDTTGRLILATTVATLSLALNRRQPLRPRRVRKAGRGARGEHRLASTLLPAGAGRDLSERRGSRAVLRPSRTRRRSSRLDFRRISSPCSWPSASFAQRRGW